MIGSPEIIEAIVNEVRRRLQQDSYLALYMVHHSFSLDGCLKLKIATTGRAGVVETECMVRLDSGALVAPAVRGSLDGREEQPKPEPPRTATKTGRSADVESFKKKILAAEGYEPTNKDIRIVAGRPEDPRSFENFQYNIAKASKPAIEAYDAVLKEPAEFTRKLRQLKPESKPKRKSRR